MDLQSLLDRHRVRYDSSGRGKNRPGWLNLQCPFCGRDPYLGINTTSLGCSCWNCGRHGLSDTIIALTGLTGPEVYALIGELPRERTPDKVKPRGKIVLPEGVGPLLSPHRQYLKSRNFDPHRLTKLWGVQGINHLGGRLAWRIFIPVMHELECLSWTTRRLNNEEPRYHDAKPEQSVVHLKDCIYGVDYCRNSIILVEGAPTVWTIGPGSGCTFGLRASPAQLQVLSRFPLRVILFDSGPREAAAEARARTLCRDLSVFDGQTILVRLESAKNADGADPAEVEELRRRFLR